MRDAKKDIRSPLKWTSPRIEIVANIYLQHRTRIFLLISLVKSVQLLMESGPQWENIQTIDGVIRLTFNYLNMNEL